MGRARGGGTRAGGIGRRRTGGSGTSRAVPGVIGSLNIWL